MAGSHTLLCSILIVLCVCAFSCFATKTHDQVGGETGSLRREEQENAKKREGKNCFIVLLRSMHHAPEGHVEIVRY